MPDAAPPKDLDLKLTELQSKVTELEGRIATLEKSHPCPLCAPWPCVVMFCVLCQPASTTEAGTSTAAAAPASPAAPASGLCCVLCNPVAFCAPCHPVTHCAQCSYGGPGIHPLCAPCIHPLCVQCYGHSPCVTPLCGPCITPLCAQCYGHSPCVTPLCGPCITPLCAQCYSHSPCVTPLCGPCITPLSVLQCYSHSPCVTPLCGPAVQYPTRAFGATVTVRASRRCVLRAFTRSALNATVITRLRSARRASTRSALTAPGIRRLPRSARRAASPSSRFLRSVFYGPPPGCILCSVRRAAVCSLRQLGAQCARYAPGSSCPGGAHGRGNVVSACRGRFSPESGSFHHP